jgi:hypothetical protein
MNKSYKILVSIGLLVMVIAGCGNTKPGLGESFTLKVGQTVTIDGEDLKLKFDSVVSDSRCPSDVVCVWAGEAEVRLIATQNGADTPLVLVEEGLTSGLNVVDYKNYTIRFKLTPYPVSTHQIQTSEYRLELTVTKS